MALNYKNTVGYKAQMELQNLRAQQMADVQNKKQEQAADSANFWNMQMKQRQMDQAARASDQDFQMRMAEMQGKFAAATGQPMDPESLKRMQPTAAMGYITGAMQGQQDRLSREQRFEDARLDRLSKQLGVAGKMQTFQESEELHPYRKEVLKGRAEMYPVWQQVQQLNKQISERMRSRDKIQKLLNEDAWNQEQREIDALMQKRNMLTSQLGAAGQAFGAPGGGHDPDNPYQ